ncbi:hypothetical protein FX988_04347 (plasmid) [Paraglaciecola mesophila]|uniref:Lipoprotein n=1 Tax=Paraglaciecola mesophila TaxID=197222 RepID=A0A857JPQ0_9ALTE|nr:hypothetical protein [Paraglaciecola mesophila]QHJ14065.1 hypothetical protein FX988_04347 [Paraglaciecola mesophila]
MRKKLIWFYLFLNALLFGCGGDKVGSGDEDQTDNIDEIVVTIEAIDSMWVSGPENVITSWNNQLLIPSSSGLLTINLDENGFIDRTHLYVESPFPLFEVQNNILAAHDTNKIIFYSYDGIELDELSRTDEQALRQVPFTSGNDCFYWVTTMSATPFSNTVWEACNVDSGLDSNIVVSSDTFITSIISLPDDRLITVGKGELNTLVSLYKKQGESYQLLSTVREPKTWSVLDLEYRDNYIYIDSGPSDNPDFLGEGGLVRFSLAGDIIANKTKLSGIITDNANYDHLAFSPHGIILGNDKKIVHFLIDSQGKVEKIVSADVANSVASIFVKGNYIITVLRAPPSSFSSNQTEPTGVYIYSLNSVM